MAQSAEKFDAEYDIALRFGMRKSFRQRLFEHVGQAYDKQAGSELTSTPAKEASKLSRASWMAETATVKAELLGGLGIMDTDEHPPTAPPLEDSTLQPEGS